MRIAKIAFLVLVLFPVSCKRKPPATELHVHQPTISPDGKSAVFSTHHLSPGGRETLRSELILLDLGTGSSRTLMRSRARKLLGKEVKHRLTFYDFCWSPDNKTIFARGSRMYSQERRWHGA